MIKKTITWVDPFTEEEKTDDFYFNIGKDGLIELELGVGGDGYSALLQRISETEDGPAMLAEFRRLVKISYGVRTEAGGFKQSPELSDEFMESGAFGELFFSLFSNPNDMANFVAGILPKSLGVEVDKAVKEMQEAVEGQQKAIQDVQLPAEAEVVEASLVEENVFDTSGPGVLEGNDGVSVDDAAEELTDEQLATMPFEEVKAYFERRTQQ